MVTGLNIGYHLLIMIIDNTDMVMLCTALTCKHSLYIPYIIYDVSLMKISLISINKSKNILKVKLASCMTI